MSVGSNPIPFGSFGVVYADPPWAFENWSAAGSYRNATAHYDCVSTDDICALREPLNLDFVCAPDCVLVMWATFPMLPDAFRVMSAWGFRYKTGGAWGKLTSTGKPAFGTGYVYRSASEPWLLGVRGEPQERTKNTRNLILSERREHSRKPDEMVAMIERQFRGPYLELFARTERPGWHSWGNQTSKFSGAA